MKLYTLYSSYLKLATNPHFIDVHFPSRKCTDRERINRLTCSVSNLTIKSKRTWQGVQKLTTGVQCMSSSLPYFHSHRSHLTNSSKRGYRGPRLPPFLGSWKQQRRNVSSFFFHNKKKKNIILLWFETRTLCGSRACCEMCAAGFARACPCRRWANVRKDAELWESLSYRLGTWSALSQTVSGTFALPKIQALLSMIWGIAESTCPTNEPKSNWFGNVYSRILYNRYKNAIINPARRLKLYIHEVDAALKTLHQMRWYSLLTRNSHAFGRWSESLPGRSSPSLPHFSIKYFRRFANRCSVSVALASSNIFSSCVKPTSSLNATWLFLSFLYYECFIISLLQCHIYRVANALSKNTTTHTALFCYTA